MRKGNIIFVSALLFFATGVAGSVAAQDLVIYPAKGQSQEQLEKDKYDCYSWAKQQTGFDPMQAASASQQPTQSQPIGGERLRGAARGAAVGAVAGEIANDDAGGGAAAGAAAGTMIGGMQQRQKRRQQAESQQQQAAATSQSQSNYNRAFGACMEGRGYTVK